MPRVHQSTALVCPLPLMTSGAMYSSVPTNELVLKSAMHDRVSIVGSDVVLAPFLPTIIVGFPPGADCFDRSKSESIMWPDWWRRMSGRLLVLELDSKNVAAWRGLTLGLEIPVDEPHEVEVL